MSSQQNVIPSHSVIPSPAFCGARNPFIRVITLILLFFILTNPVFGQKQEILGINDDIAKKKKQYQELNRQIELYQKSIRKKQTEATNLQNQIYILQNRIALMELEIQATQIKIEEINLEIKALVAKIQETEAKIEKQKEKLGDVLMKIHQYDQKSYLEILISHPTFSSFFDQLKALQSLENNLQDLLNEVQNLKTTLEGEKQSLEEKKQELENAQKQLQQKKESLQEQQYAKEFLLSETRDSEKKFQNLLSSLREEERRVEAEISNLEKTMRQRLETLDKSFIAGDVIFSWPVDPGRGLTAIFHDPDYPYRYLFEHPAIDVRVKQGTVVQAAAAGYVAKVRAGGFRYSYIMLIHASGFATVYGHLSKITAKEGTFVSRGETIGFSGGMPGTPGAGPWTTGPHLHFEVRKNGIPVDPLGYLL